MEDQHHHQSHFDYAFSRYYEFLKISYIDGVEGSLNKDYATNYFRTMLFEENAAIPAATVFFDELRTIYNHLYNLHGESAAVRSIGYLETIREKSREALGIIERFYDGSGEPGFVQLPIYYEVQLDGGAIPRDIIAQEKQVLELSEQQLMELLGLYAATEKLKVEFRPGAETPNPEPQTEKSRKDAFTRSQQVLIFHYFLHASGVNPGSGAFITDCARLLHRLVGLAIPDEMSNSDLYKKLKHPHGEWDASTLKDLRAILPYFEKLPHFPIVKLINQDINSIANGD